MDRRSSQRRPYIRVARLPDGSTVDRGVGSGRACFADIHEGNVLQTAGVTPRRRVRFHRPWEPSSIREIRTRVYSLTAGAGVTCRERTLTSVPGSSTIFFAHLSAEQLTERMVSVR